MTEPAARIDGACHCGAVRVALAADATGVLVCHCGDCQKLHGNAFAFLAVEAADARIDGASHVRWYDSSPKARRAFCDVCGSRLFKAPTGTTRLLVSIGLFDGALPKRVVKELYGEHKPAWYA